MSCRMKHAWILVALVLAVRTSRADGVADDEPWRYRTSAVAVDAGVVVALPVALQTGLARGAGAGIAIGERFSLGVRASWATATEMAIGWAVTHDDVRAAVTGGAAVKAGRGSLGVRLGLGGAMVHETRRRVRGDLAGATGEARETAATAWFPSAELDAVLALHIAGAWTLVISGGPSVVRVERDLHTGWTSQLGVGWQL